MLKAASQRLRLESLRNIRAIPANSPIDQTYGLITPRCSSISQDPHTEPHRFCPTRYEVNPTAPVGGLCVSQNRCRPHGGAKPRFGLLLMSGKLTCCIASPDATPSPPSASLLQGVVLPRSIIRFSPISASVMTGTIANSSNSRSMPWRKNRPKSIKMATRAGVLPISPMNQVGMLTGYVDPGETFIAWAAGFCCWAVLCSWLHLPWWEISKRSKSPFRRPPRKFQVPHRVR